MPVSCAAVVVERVIRSRRVVTESGVQPASIHVAGGVIRDVAGYDQIPAGAPIDDAGDLVVMAGLVDSHVHVNEPGRTEWEGFESATRAAAAGGITTIVDMPLNSIPVTTSLAAFEQKLASTEGKLWVDVGFWGGVVPGNLAELEPMVKKGVLGFKCFMVPSGIEEFAEVGEADIAAALDVLGDCQVPLLAHAEAPGPISRAADEVLGDSPYRYLTYLRSRPSDAEDQAIALLIGVLRKRQKGRIHVVHCASGKAVELLAAAKQEGLAIGAETCPHYLHLSAENVPDGATEYKCAPPIREQVNRERLWQGVDQSVLDMVVSDHSPCTPDLKRKETGDFMAAWGGIASLQLTLPVIWTEMKRRGLPLERIGRWMSHEPARLVGLHRRKGQLAAGFDADITVWDPDANFTVRGAELEHRSHLTPYDGEALFGRVETTYLAGTIVYQRGAHSSAPTGRRILGT